ncbi:MAG: hypothetical protein GY711_14565 [bacterium]|nr:hypothetical protein [bacterium]
MLFKHGDPILAEGDPAPGTAAQTVLELRDCDLNDNLAVLTELTGGFALYYAAPGTRPSARPSTSA